MKNLVKKAMSGQLPSPIDFINSRDEFSWFEFPEQYGQIEFPSLFPAPGELGMKEYLKLKKELNKIKDVEEVKDKKMFKTVTKKIIKKKSSAPIGLKNKLLKDEGEYVKLKDHVDLINSSYDNNDYFDDK